VDDITERKQASNEPRESEERHRRLVETANEGIWLIDSEARTTFVNPRMAGILDQEPAEIVGALGMFSDITERKRAEAGRDRLLTCERAACDEAVAAQRQLALLARASELLASSLGLAICRAIVEAHGGRIWAENRPSGGARLVVRLPLGGATAPEHR
jgi:signal transduction histidine kinase